MDDAQEQLGSTRRLRLSVEQQDGLARWFRHVPLGDAAATIPAGNTQESSVQLYTTIPDRLRSEQRHGARGLRLILT